MDQTNEDDEPVEETLDFTKPDFEFRPHELHEWRQQGPYLLCKSCDLEHAVYIGMEKLLTGINEQGQPILIAR